MLTESSRNHKYQESPHGGNQIKGNQAMYQKLPIGTNRPGLIVILIDSLHQWRIPTAAVLSGSSQR
jgi:hypothetical protein